MKTQLLFCLCLVCGVSYAQQAQLQYFRPNDKTGLNVFETTKPDTIPYTGFRIRIGGNFTQDLQALRHENSATPVIEDDVNINELVSLTNGFNLAMANLNIDAQLHDGIRMNLTMYLSSRNHEDAWVKGGYVQFDKLGFLRSAALDSLMRHLTIKIGDYEIEYGDQHYRRSDGGNTIFNPFVENYIMDAFTTEIGGDVYFHAENGFFALVGATNGQLNPTVRKSTRIDTVTGERNTYTPAFHGKLGFDKQFTGDLRFRVTGSFYTIKSSSNSTLFFGDRAGSHYFFVLENTLATSADNSGSGRFNPQFNDQVTTFMINPFLIYRGLELFGTYEVAKGRMVTEVEKRTATQYAVDLIYRFPAASRNFWIGGRYNTVTATLPFNPNNIRIQRMTGSIGWFATKHIMVKAEYVNQEYEDFPSDDIRAGGKFDGVMVQAAIAF